MTPPSNQTEARRRKLLDKEEREVRWYVLRDLRRPNVKSRGYHLLQRNRFEVFTPMRWEREKHLGLKMLVEHPIIPDLLIVHSSVAKLREMITFENKLQYRYLHGGWQKRMTVSDSEMKRFKQAMSEASFVEYYSPNDFNPSRIGESIVIKGGAFDGQEGILLSVNGTKRKSIVVRLANLFVAVIELKNQPDDTANLSQPSQEKPTQPTSEIQAKL